LCLSPPPPKGFVAAIIFVKHAYCPCPTEKAPFSILRNPTLPSSLWPKCSSVWAWLWVRHRYVV
jgi:hypothetical protein